MAMWVGPGAPWVLSWLTRNYVSRWAKQNFVVFVRVAEAGVEELPVVQVHHLLSYPQKHSASAQVVVGSVKAVNASPEPQSNTKTRIS